MSFFGGKLIFTLILDCFRTFKFHYLGYSWFDIVVTYRRGIVGAGGKKGQKDQRPTYTYSILPERGGRKRSFLGKIMVHDTVQNRSTMCKNATKILANFHETCGEGGIRKRWMWSRLWNFTVFRYKNCNAQEDLRGWNMIFAAYTDIPSATPSPRNIQELE